MRPSISGKTSTDVVFDDNDFEDCVSQNIAVTSARRGRVTNNRIRRINKEAPPPGSTPIDVEPNNGDQIDDVLIAYNDIDASDSALYNGSPTVNCGITINGLNETLVFRGVRVEHNRVRGATHDAPWNRVTYAGVYLTRAGDTIVSDNVIARVSRVVVVAGETQRASLLRNILVDCGSGGTNSFEVMEGSTGNIVAANRFEVTPGDALDLKDRGRVLVVAAGNIVGDNPGAL